MADFDKLVADLTLKKRIDPAARQRALDSIIDERLFKESSWELINEIRRGMDLSMDYAKPNVIGQWFKKLFKRNK